MVVLKVRLSLEEIQIVVSLITFKQKLRHEESEIAIGLPQIILGHDYWVVDSELPHQSHSLLFVSFVYA
jgi:hypothetical protein